MSRSVSLRTAGRPATDVSRSPSASAAFSPALIEQLQTIEQAFGGREQVIATLACAPKSADLDYLLNLLASARAQESLADLCVDASIRPAELLQHLSAGKYHLARTLSTRSLPEHLPQTVSHLLRDSHDHEAECTICRGSGERQSGESVRPCYACHGTGRRVERADPDARTQALELSGLLGKSGGVTVNAGVQNVIQTGSGGGAFERVQEAAAAVLRASEGQYQPTGVSAEDAAAQRRERPQATVVRTVEAQVVTASTPSD